MILDFPYLDQVIHEVLRIIPPATRYNEAKFHFISFRIALKKIKFTDLLPYTEQRGNAIRTLPTGKLKLRKEL